MSKAVEIEGYMLRVHTRYYDQVNGVVVCKKGENDKMFFSFRRPHGEWIDSEDNNYCKCSICGNIVMIEEVTKYCGSCGASMSKLQANGEQVKTNQWCKFKSEKNCDFCAFHSDCEIHWKDGDE